MEPDHPGLQYLQCVPAGVLRNLPEAEGKIIHIIDVLGKEIKGNYDSVSLMASEGTIDTGIFSQRFEPFGITVHAPGKEDIRYPLLDT